MRVMGSQDISTRLPDPCGGLGFGGGFGGHMLSLVLRVVAGGVARCELGSADASSEVPC